MPNPKTNSRKRLKICCAITTILFAIFIIVFVILFFTVFKPKQPIVTAHPASLENIQFQMFPLSLNATLALIVTIDNRNYGGFKYKNATAYVDYHGTNVAQVAIESNTVPAHSNINISTYANISGDKLTSSPYFWGDVGAGRFNFTSTAMLHGKVNVLKIFKMGARVVSFCDISVLIQSQDVDSTCYSKIKL